MKPISFTPEVLKAKMRVLEEHGHFMTRRPLKMPNPERWPFFAEADLSKAWADNTSPFGPCLKVPCTEETVQRVYAPWTVGEVLWLRERALVLKVLGPSEALKVLLRYDDGNKSEWVPYPARLKPPREGRCIANGVFREGARHFFEVVSVKAERAADISEDDAVLEGILRFGREWTFNEGLHLSHTAQESFRALWTSIYGPDAWEQWCWAYTLRKATP